MQNPLVSITVLTYNQEGTITQTLDSLLSQKTTYSYEIIIGEDSSTDSTRAICQDYADRYPHIIRLLDAAPNKGIMRNTIDTMKAIRGKYTMGCAGDDYWCDLERLQKQVDFLENNSDYVLVHSESQRLIIETGQLISPPLRTNVPNGYIHDKLYKEAIIQAPTVCYRSELIQYIDLEQWRKLNFLMEDIPMWLEFSRQGKIFYMPSYLTVYRVAIESACHSASLQKNIEFIDSLYRCLYYYWDKFKPNFPRTDLNKLYKLEIIHRTLASKQMGPICKLFFTHGFFRVSKLLLKLIKNKL